MVFYLLGIDGQQVIDHRFDATGCLFETFFCQSLYQHCCTHPAKSSSKLSIRFGFWNFCNN